jgi:hypothetical protein
MRVLSETFLGRDITVNVHTSSHKVSAILVIFNETWIFSIDFEKIFQYQIPWKSVQWEPSCFMRTDGQAGRLDEASSRFW